MLKRFFEAKSFIFHVPKPIQVPTNTYFRHTVDVACIFLKKKKHKTLKHDLKPSGAFFREFACDLGFAAYETFGQKAPAGRLSALYRLWDMKCEAFRFEKTF